MFESIINPKRAERKPWQMFILGFIYASIAVGVSWLVFGRDPVLSKYIGLFVILFTVAFTLPYVFYTLKIEERKDKEYEEEIRITKEHGKALLAFLFLFAGFVIAFSIWYIVLDNGPQFFRAQIETFCKINRPGTFNECLTQYGLQNSKTITGSVSESTTRLISIFTNNIYVLIFTILFSLLFGAGAIFILAWNASVIAAAIGIFTKSDISHLPLGILRYFIHGIPEIAAYFVAAMAGGILGIAIVKRDLRTDRFFKIFGDVLNLVIIAIVILFLAALIEVFITPRLF
jgi:stage II sporulation protein M